MSEHDNETCQRCGGDGLNGNCPVCGGSGFLKRGSSAVQSRIRAVTFNDRPMTQDRYPALPPDSSLRGTDKEDGSRGTFGHRDANGRFGSYPAYDDYDDHDE